MIVDGMMLEAPCRKIMWFNKKYNVDKKVLIALLEKYNYYVDKLGIFEKSKVINCFVSFAHRNDKTLKEQKKQNKFLIKFFKKCGWTLHIIE